MAVAFDAATESHPTANTFSVNQTSFTWDHTPVGTPRGVVVVVGRDLHTDMDSVTVTYGGVSVPVVATAGSNVADYLSAGLFFLGSSIPTGTQAVVVTRPNDSEPMAAYCATVTAGADTEVHGLVTVQGSVTIAEQNVDDGLPGSNSLRFAGGANGENAVIPVGANTTLLGENDPGNRTFTFARETTAGQGSRPVGYTSAVASDRAVFHFAVRQFGTTENLSVSVYELNQYTTF